MGFSSLKDLKKNSNIQTLIDQANKMTQGSYAADERYWNPTVDKNGNGAAIIRFLPVTKGEEIPFVRLWTHGFKGPTGQWYIENSLTTIGQQDAIAELNTQLWNSGRESDKETARSRKRKLYYISNIYVVKDPASPQNEGKVFLFKYGAKIFEKINNLMNPEFEDQAAVNPFDLWEGANLRLRIKNKDGFRNYDESSFDPPKALSDDDDVLEKIWNTQYPLQPEIAPDKFKSPEELRKRLELVLGGRTAAPKITEDVEDSPMEKAPQKEPVFNKTATKKASPMDDDDDEDPQSFFAGLVDD